MPKRKNVAEKERERERETTTTEMIKKCDKNDEKKKLFCVKTVEREVKDQFFICIASFFCDAAF
jgi:hypothetical protein